MTDTEKIMKAALEKIVNKDYRGQVPPPTAIAIVLDLRAIARQALAEVADAERVRYWNRVERQERD